MPFSVPRSPLSVPRSPRSAAVRAEPTGGGERIELLDILRGFALLGILVVNFWGSPGTAVPTLDAVFERVLDLGAESSFYPLYSLLFGLGFGLQLARGQERAAPVLGRYLRRIFWLFVIGTAHALLIWKGDILMDYALLGVLLIPFGRLRARWLLLIALGIVLATPKEPVIRGWVAELRGAPPPAAAERPPRVDDFDPESYTEAVALRWAPYKETFTRYRDPVDWFTTHILALFLVGLAAGRAGVARRSDAHRRLFLGLLIGGAACALAGNAAPRLVPEQGPLFGGVAWTMANYGVTAVYVGAIALLVLRGGRAAGALRAFAPAGRMALTNYLLQSIVMAGLFANWALGLDEPATTAWLALNLLFFFGVQIPLSRAWLARYRFGPAEWLWRSLTYGARQPLRLARTAASPHPL